MSLSAATHSPAAAGAILRERLDWLREHATARAGHEPAVNGPLALQQRVRRMSAAARAPSAAPAARSTNSLRICAAA